MSGENHVSLSKKTVGSGAFWSHDFLSFYQTYLCVICQSQYQNMMANLSFDFLVMRNNMNVHVLFDKSHYFIK